MTNFFISNVFGVLIIATLGAILGPIIVQQSSEAKIRLKTLITKSGTGYFVWRLITNLFYLVFISWYVLIAITTYQLRGFQNGASFVIDCLFVLFFVGRLLAYNGVTAYTVLDKTADAWIALKHWVSAKPDNHSQPEKEFDLSNAIKHLDDKVFADSETVMSKITDLGETAVEPLLTALNSTNKDIRANAARVLGRIRDARAAKPLLAKLENDKEIRFQAALALVNIGDDAIQLLVEAAKHGDAEVREAAVFSLGQSRNILAVAPLQKLLEEYVTALEDKGKALINEAGEEIIASSAYDMSKRYEVYKNLRVRADEHFDFRAWWFPRNVGSALGSLASSCLKKKEKAE